MVFFLFCRSKRCKTRQSFDRRGAAQAYRKRVNSFADQVWLRSPAFVFAITFVFGSALKFYPSYSLFFVALLWGTVILRTRYAMWAFGALCFFYTSLPVSVEDEKTVGRGVFFIENIQSSPKGGWNYRGYFPYYAPHDKKPLKNIRCWTHSYKKRKGNHWYLLEGTLKKKRKSFSFQVEEWKEGDKRWCFTEFRFQMKQWVRKEMEHSYPDGKVSSFLSALILGELQDKLLRFEFARVGLSHVLAISGLHFGFLILFLHFLVQRFVSRKKTSWIVFCFAHFYFLFLGFTPSIFRAWIMTSLYLLGQLFTRRASALNFLGVALLIEMILDPMVLTHLGFQLSFLSCLSLLWIYPVLEKILCIVIPKRSVEEIGALSMLSAHGNLLSQWIRKGLSVTLAVHLAIGPILLFHFHKFPLLSFIYNLFIPPLMSICMFLFLIGLCIPFGGVVIHGLNKVFISSLLALITSVPPSLEYSVQTRSLSASSVVLYLCLILSLFFARSHQTRNSLRNVV